MPTPGRPFRATRQAARRKQSLTFSAVFADLVKMRFPGFLNRKKGRATSSASPRHAPSARPQAEGEATPVWRALWQRLLSGDSDEAEETRLVALRRAFVDALHDIDTPASVDLALRATHARSMREIWHLRPELYNLVARAQSQVEAERRVALVNAHFPDLPGGARRQRSTLGGDSR